MTTTTTTMMMTMVMMVMMSMVMNNNTNNNYDIVVPVDSIEDVVLANSTVAKHLGPDLMFFVVVFLRHLGATSKNGSFGCTPRRNTTFT